MNIGCCHIALALVIIILPLVAMLTNRTLKAEARVTKLEKKNGAEQKQINQIKLEVEKKNSQELREIEELKERVRYLEAKNQEEETGGEYDD